MLDEPSIGLHQRDNDRLLTTLKRLRDLGNTVLVVEHDEDAIRSGRLPDRYRPRCRRAWRRSHRRRHASAKSLKCAKSITAQYLTGKKFIPVPTQNVATRAMGMWIEVINAHGNNLKNM